MKILDKERKLCLCCMEEHEVKRVIIAERNIFKKESVEYDAEYFYCDCANELYADEQLISLNDIAMKNSCRMKKLRQAIVQDISKVQILRTCFSVVACVILYLQQDGKMRQDESDTLFRQELKGIRQDAIRRYQAMRIILKIIVAPIMLASYADCSNPQFQSFPCVLGTWASCLLSLQCAVCSSCSFRACL